MDDYEIVHRSQAERQVKIQRQSRARASPYDRPSFLRDTARNHSRVSAMLLFTGLIYMLLMMTVAEPMLESVFMLFAVFSILTLVVIQFLPNDSVLVGSLAVAMLIIFLFMFSIFIFFGGIILYIGNQLFGWDFSWTVATMIGFLFSVLYMALARD